MIAVKMREGCDNAMKWLAKPVPGNFENVESLNSQWSDWGTAFFNGKIIFASDRPYDSLRKNPFFSNSNIRRSVYNWTGNGYLHLYEADELDSSSTKLLGRNINGDYHSATASYTADGNAMYYAVTSFIKKSRSFLGKEGPYSLNGRVLDRKTGMPLPNAVVTLKNKQTGTSLQVITDNEGRYHFQLDGRNDHALSIVKTDYSTITAITVTTKDIGISGELRKDIALEKAEINKPYKVENIYFDLDKSNIRPDAAAELDKLARLLNDNPTWEVEISSHTDARANDKYNLKLSQRRAESTVAYLLSQGISKERLIAKGYGETALVNHCTNGVQCTEEEHQANRRTEFTILDK